jgi:hypothetical protein
MCEKCVEAVKRWYPELPENQWSGLLLGATCFPFGGPEQVEEQLKELREKTDGTLRGALKFADDEMCAEMDRYQDRRIRLLAYKKWEKAGYPQGDGVNFWLEAEKDYHNFTEDDD